MRNLEKVILKVQKNVTNNWVKCSEEALGEKILRNKTNPLHYWNEEIGQLVKENKNKSIRNGLVQKIHRT